MQPKMKSGKVLMSLLLESLDLRTEDAAKSKVYRKVTVQVAGRVGSGGAEASVLWVWPWTGRLQVAPGRWYGREPKPQPGNCWDDGGEGVPCELCA